jgi:hypothetical protein
MVWQGLALEVLDRCHFQKPYFTTDRVVATKLRSFHIPQCSIGILQAIVLSGITFLFTVSFSDSKQMMQDLAFSRGCAHARFRERPVSRP